MNNDYLEHHGILGMKWGVRRYQNKDGSLTSTGKRRNSKSYRREVKKSQRQEVYDKVKDGVSKQKERAAKNSKSYRREVKKSQRQEVYKKVGNAINKQKEKKKKILEMSDAELKEKVNRLNLENQYKNLNSNNVSRGRAIAQRSIKNLTSATAITSSGVTLYNNVKTIKKILGK